MNQTAIRGLPGIHLVIAVAGFTFLLYEVSWNRLLSIALGTTVLASTIVLAVFMAGIGLGAYFWGCQVSRTMWPARLLALLTIGIGALGAVSFLVITEGLPQLYDSLASAGFSMTGIELIAFAIAGITLFASTFLMGGVFPIVSKIVIYSDRAVAPSLGRLYALETLGSAVGGLATGFILLGMIGQLNTIMLAVVTNLLLGAWLLVFRRTADGSASAQDTESAGGKTVTGRSGRTKSGEVLAALRRSALLGTFVCGFAILGLQVLWLRMLRIYLTNTSYTFALVSSLVILGLFAGSMAYKRWGVHSADQHRSMLKVLFFMAIAVVIGLILLVFLPEIIILPLSGLLANPVMRVFLLPVLVSLLVVFPAAAISGYAFPLACRMYTEGAATIGRDVGFVLMTNTAGSVLGPVIAAFVLLPLLGVSLAVVLMIGILTVAGLMIVREVRPGSFASSVRIAMYGGLFVVVAVLVIQPNIRILPPSFSRFERDVLFYRESVEGTLSVGRDAGEGEGQLHTYVNNSAVIGSSYDAIKVVKMVGHYPFFIRSEDDPPCEDVLVIGFGIGVTTSAIAQHDEVQSIECVELVAGLRDAAGYYSDLNHDVIDDPRLTMVTGDGRHYLAMTRKRYDLISCDPTHPILGSGNLYTREYFALCREHLKPGGVVSQYLPLHKLGTEELLGIIATFHAEFTHATVWLGHYHAVLLGSTEPIEIDFNSWVERISDLGQDPHFYSDPFHLAATLVLDGRTIAQLTEAARLNSDNRSYTEFFDPACLDEDNIGKNLKFFIDNRTDLRDVFVNIGNPLRLSRFYQGNRLLTESLYHRLNGDHERSLQVLRQATQVNPEDQEFPFLIRLYY
ncbi:hypothetical protein GF377_02750 [candidate division GN15 bacterium]|nr:hypothetical protein [candidate division GN15 bacterium]